MKILRSIPATRSRNALVRLAQGYPGHLLAACALVFASLASLAPLAPAWAADYRAEYSLSIVPGLAGPWGQGALKWAELVRERSNGRINIRVHPDAALVQGRQTIEFTALAGGEIDMAVGSTINWSPQVNELNLFSLPFLVRDYQSIDALTRGKTGSLLFDSISKNDVVPLAWGENGFRQISNSVREISSPEDIRGLKLRVVASSIFIDIFTALGATPIQMDWKDALPALASGAVDGQENPVSVYAQAGLYKTRQKFLTLWNHVADPLVFAVSRSAWDSWQPSDQEIVRQAAIDAAYEQVLLARKGVLNTSDTLLKQLAGQGVSISVLSAGQLDAFAQATQPVFDKWAAQIGEDLVKQAQAEIAARQKPSDP